MNRLTILALVALLSGCAYADIISVKGAEASDEILRDAIWVVCQATPVGALRRRFSTEDKMFAWKLLCADDQVFSP